MAVPLPGPDMVVTHATSSIGARWSYNSSVPFSPTDPENYNFRNRPPISSPRGGYRVTATSFLSSLFALCVHGTWVN